MPVSDVDASDRQEQRAPSPEEVQRVCEFECKTRGHTWTTVDQVGHEIPCAILCTHCGKTAPLSKPQSRGVMPRRP